MTASRMSASRRIRALFDIRNRYDADASAEKLQLLEEMAHCVVEVPSDLQQLHTALCFIRAFPDTERHYRHARKFLLDFHERVANLPRRQQRALDDSGIAGTSVFYAFSFHVARWLARRAPGAISIDWPELDEPGRLDELLELVLHGSEDEYFNSGWVSGREWLNIARGETGEFDWLIAQMNQAALARAFALAYDAANLPLRWRLRDSRWSRTRNVYPARQLCTRQTGMRRRPASAKREILRPLRNVNRLSRREGIRMIDVAMASLAVRHRETWHFNHANPGDV